SERASTINARLARAAARVGLGMALGSQRAMVLRPELTPTFAVRREAPSLPLLFGNVGAVQLNYPVAEGGVDARVVHDMVRAVDADALFFHLNPLQEAIQPEGDTRFSSLSARLRETVAAL